MKIANHTNRAITVSLVLAGLSALYLGQSAFAQISVDSMKKLVMATKEVPFSGSVSVKRINEQVLVEISAVNTADSGSLKEAAFAVARAIMHADPGYVRGVICRFYSGDRSFYTDVLVTGKDLVSVEAGIESKQAVKNRMPAIRIGSQQSSQNKFASYLVEADRLRVENQLYAAQTFFQFAFEEDSSLAQSSPKFAKGLFDLGRAFDLRGDLGQADLAYGKVLTLAKANKGAVSAEILRQIASFFKSQGDYQNGRDAIKLVLDAGDGKSLKEKAGQNGDLRMLAYFYRNLGQFSMAKSELEQALLVTRNLSGENNPDVALILEELGDCYQSEGNSRQALSFYSQAKNKYNSSMASRHAKMRIDYEIYQGALNRLQKKMRSLKQTG